MKIIYFGCFRFQLRLVGVLTVWKSIYSVILLLNNDFSLHLFRYNECLFLLLIFPYKTC